MIMSKIVDLIMKSNKIGVTFHESPDGDSLGSCLGLVNGLRLINKDVYIISKEAVPETFSYLPLSNEIDGTCPRLMENTDLLITLDCGNVERLNISIDWENRNVPIINIDHHLSNDLFGDINHVVTNAAAVAEIIFELLKELNININEDIATCLYTSLLTDTGSFRHSNTTTKTHQIAGELIKTGFDFSAVHRKIFDNKKFEIIKLQGLVINDMYLNDNKKLCILKLTKKMLAEVGSPEVDSAELVSIGLKIDSVQVSMLLKEKDNVVKVSLRSKNEVDVRKIAEAFGGGGHTKASGLSLNMTIEEAEIVLRKEIEKELI